MANDQEKSWVLGKLQPTKPIWSINLLLFNKFQCCGKSQMCLCMFWRSMLTKLGNLGQLQGQPSLAEGPCSLWRNISLNLASLAINSLWFLRVDTNVFSQFLVLAVCCRALHRPPSRQHGGSPWPNPHHPIIATQPPPWARSIVWWITRLRLAWRVEPGALGPLSRFLTTEFSYIYYILTTEVSYIFVISLQLFGNCPGWIFFWHLDTCPHHLGRANLSWENTSIRLVCW